MRECHLTIRVHPRELIHSQSAAAEQQCPLLVTPPLPPWGYRYPLLSRPTHPRTPSTAAGVSLSMPLPCKRTSLCAPPFQTHVRPTPAALPRPRCPAGYAGAIVYVMIVMLLYHVQVRQGRVAVGALGGGVQRTPAEESIVRHSLLHTSARSSLPALRCNPALS